MAEYYGVTRTPEYLMHYGVRGMKWGVRKAIDRIRSNMRMSRDYMKAQQKLKRATIAGGIIGGTAYAVTHKKQLNAVKAASASSNAMQKPQSKIASNFQKSRDYMNAHKKLQKKMMGAQIVGGLAGSAIYAAKHRKELSKASNSASGVGTKSNVPNKKRNLRAEAMASGDRAIEAKKNLSFLGKHGFGRTAKAYREANTAARDATNAYYNSLTKKQYAKLRRNHVG